MNGKGKIVSCIVSGIIFIIFGIFFGVMVILTGTDEGAGVVAGVILIALFAVGMGIWQISRGIKFSKGEEPRPQDKEESARTAAKAEERLDNINRRRKSSMRAEICGTQRAAAAITAVLCIGIALFITAVYKGSLINIYTVLMGVFAVGMLIYGFADISYRRLLKSVKAQGLGPAAVGEDFLKGELYKDFAALLNIGNEYTVFVDETKGFIVRNADIRRVFVIHEDTDMYNTGVYAGSVTKSYLILDTQTIQYKFRFSNGLDRRVIAAYMARIAFLDPSCEIYPAET